MERVYNFSAGPSMLPLPVLEKAANEMLCYEDSGMSVMEMSHRSPVYDKIIKDAEAKLRELMNIPDNYKVLFLQGGASTQFSAVPLNLLNGSGKADYIVSGQFSGKAYKEAQKYGDVVCAATSKDANFTFVPKTDRNSFRPDADYVHICFNNTIYGTKFPYIPDTGDIPLVADMSSCIISEPVDVSKFGLIYGGAQEKGRRAGTENLPHLRRVDKRTIAVTVAHQHMLHALSAGLFLHILPGHDHIGLIEQIAVSATPLGTVHSQIGLAVQLFEGGAVLDQLVQCVVDVLHQIGIILADGVVVDFSLQKKEPRRNRLFYRKKHDLISKGEGTFSV